MDGFKEILQYLRKREGISQAELALRIGISPSAIGNYESGTRKPTNEIEETLADYFNVSLDFLRGIDSEKRRVSEDEFDIIEAYRNADELDRAMVRRVLGIREKKGSAVSEEVG